MDDKESLKNRSPFSDQLTIFDAFTQPDDFASFQLDTQKQIILALAKKFNEIHQLRVSDGPNPFGEDLQELSRQALNLVHRVHPLDKEPLVPIFSPSNENAEPRFGSLYQFAQMQINDGIEFSLIIDLSETGGFG